MPGPITITSPEGVPYIAPDEATLVAWAKEGRIAPDAVITQEGRPPVVASRHTLLAGAIRGGGGSGSGEAVVATVIPYKNPAALIGYYTSIASLIPFVGHFAGPAAVILGIVGFRAVLREPLRRGTAHAWIAMILGGLTTIGYWGITILAIVGAFK